MKTFAQEMELVALEQFPHSNLGSGETCCLETKHKRFRAGAQAALQSTVVREMVEALAAIKFSRGTDAGSINAANYTLAREALEKFKQAEEMWNDLNVAREALDAGTKRLP